MRLFARSKVGAAAWLLGFAASGLVWAGPGDGNGIWNSQTNLCDGVIHARITECGDLHGPEDGATNDLRGPDLLGNPSRPWLGTRLSGINLSRTLIAQTVLSSLDKPTDLRGATFIGSNLQQARFDGARLRNSSFRGSYMRLTVLRDSMLYGADFDGAKLPHAYLNRANIRFAKFTHADMRGAILRGITQADGAEFDGADLSGAALQGADLSHASSLVRAKKLEGAKFDRATQFPWGPASDNAARQKAILTYGMVFDDGTPASPAPAPAPSASPRANAMDGNLGPSVSTDVEPPPPEAIGTTSGQITPTAGVPNH